MNFATQLNHVMMTIWDSGHGDDMPVTIKALASYAKTHSRRNHENVFDVIDILFADNVKVIIPRSEKTEFDGPTDFAVDVQFNDESQVLVVCRNGIGIGLEFIS